MPRYYVDLDNNRLVTGPQSTQLAPTPKLYQGDKPVLDVELLTRTNSVLGYYTSAASAINVRVGTLGGSAVASALTLSTVTLSATATATAGLTFTSAVTATATAGVNNPTVITITPTVTTWSSALATAYLGPEAIPPVIKYSPTPMYDKYLHVEEAGTPYAMETIFETTVASVVTSFRTSINIGLPTEYITSPSNTLVAIFRAGAGSANPSYVTSLSSGSLFNNTTFQFLTAGGTWIHGSSVTSLSQINLKNEYAAVVSEYGPRYEYNFVVQRMGAAIGAYSGTWFYSNQQPDAPNYGFNYGCLVLRSNQVSSALTTAHPFTINGISVATLGINIGPAYVQSYAAGESGYKATLLNDMPYALDLNGLIEVRTVVSLAENTPDNKYYDALNYNFWWMSTGTMSPYTGADFTLVTETTPDGRKQITGGQLSIPNYAHRPLEAAAKTYPLSVYPDRAYSGRRVERIELTACGAQYATTPIVLISEPENENGLTAKAVASMANQKLAGITLTEMGSGYSAPPDVFILPPANRMKSDATRTVTSVVSSSGRTLVLLLGSGTTISDNSWCILSGLGKADGLAYVVSVATAGSQTTLKFPFNLGTVITSAAATLAPLIPYVRVTGAVVSGSDSSFLPGSVIPVSFSTPSCSDTDAVVNFSVSNSGALSLSSIPTPGLANSFSVATLTAYRKITGLTVTCAGAGYVAAPSVTVDDSAYVPTAPGAARAQITPAVNADGTIRLVLASGGYGYTSAPTITLSAPTASWPVTGLSVTCAGAGYTEAPAVSFSGGGGTGAAATAILTNGSVTSLSLTSGGSGYTSAPTVTLSAPPASVYYSKQIDLSGASVTTLLSGNSSASAYLQVEEKRGSDTTVLAQLPVTVVARVS